MPQICRSIYIVHNIHIIKKDCLFIKEVTLENRKVLIVDDSIVYREIMSAVVESIDGYSVCACVDGPLEASRSIVELEPFAMILDMGMPKMDGVTFLEKVMRLYPIPSILVSRSQKADSKDCRKAVELGALECINKPEHDNSEEIQIFKKQIETALIRVANNLSS